MKHSNFHTRAVWNTAGGSIAQAPAERKLQELFLQQKFSRIAAAATMLGSCQVLTQLLSILHSLLWNTPIKVHNNFENMLVGLKIVSAIVLERFIDMFHYSSYELILLKFFATLVCIACYGLGLVLSEYPCTVVCSVCLVSTLFSIQISFKCTLRVFVNHWLMIPLSLVHQAGFY